MRDETTDSEITGINVTPLVDVTLVLLIVFMVTAKVLATQAMPFEVPKTKTSVTTSKDLVVVIDPAGVATIDGRVVDARAIVAAAMEARAANPETKAIIRAATGASHGAVVKVMDALREGKLERIAFGVERK